MWEKRPEKTKDYFTVSNLTLFDANEFYLEMHFSCSLFSVM